MGFDPTNNHHLNMEEPWDRDARLLPESNFQNHPMNIYEFEITALCPNGAMTDRYDCRIETPRVIQAEQLCAIALDLRDKKQFQEDIADQIRQKTQARVTLTGWHFGVKITCVRE